MTIEVGNKLREIRENTGLTLEQLGEKIGKSKQWLSELERGNIRLTYEWAVKISRVYAKTPDCFLLDKSKNISQNP